LTQRLNIKFEGSKLPDMVPKQGVLTREKSQQKKGALLVEQATGV
jgi:hypothetical protein